MSIHDWGLFADNVMRAIEHPDAPVTNKEARLRDSVKHVAGNWMGQPKAHGLEEKLPLQKLKKCSDAEQIVHIICDSLPEITGGTLEETLRRVQSLSGEKKPLPQAAPPPAVHDVGHDRDVVIGFLQSAIGEVNKMKEISKESKTKTVALLRDACNEVRSSSSPMNTILSTENALKSRLAKEEAKYRSFLNWFNKTASGLQRKLTYTQTS